MALSLSGHRFGGGPCSAAAPSGVDTAGATPHPIPQGGQLRTDGPTLDHTFFEVAAVGEVAKSDQRRKM